ncbi:MAG: AtpZ/AtpI family protein [Proteobacteria bacterium]|nr:AtpZ/AtpI family protein [Pseudomonadota bacterium]
MSNDDRSSLDELDAKLRKARTARGLKDSEHGGPTGMSSSRQFGVVYRVFVELLAGILVGAGSGWVLDYVFATRPWFLLAMLFLGIVAGFANVVRATRRMTAELDAEDAAKTQQEPTRIRKE